MARAIERDAAVAERDIGIVADHQVVEDIDVEQAAGGQRLRGQVEIVGRWRRVARRVVVDEDDARGVEADRVAKQLPNADQRRADVALVGGGLPRTKTVQATCMRHASTVLRCATGVGDQAPTTGLPSIAPPRSRGASLLPMGSTNVTNGSRLSTPEPASRTGRSRAWERGTMTDMQPDLSGRNVGRKP